MVLAYEPRVASNAYMEQPLPPAQPQTSSNWRSLGMMALFVGYFLLLLKLYPLIERNRRGALIFAAIIGAILLPLYIFVFPSILGLDATGIVLLPIAVTILIVYAFIRG